MEEEYGMNQGRGQAVGNEMNDQAQMLITQLQEAIAASQIPEVQADEQMITGVGQRALQAARGLEALGIDPAVAVQDMERQAQENKINQARGLGREETMNMANQKIAQAAEGNMRTGYDQGYNAGNPVGVAAKMLAANLLKDEQPQKVPNQGNMLA